jgi:hypothetical protein
VPARRHAVVFALAAALVALVATPGAGAAVWQGPVAISEAGTHAHDTPRISLGASGDAAAGWWDDAEGGRIVITRKRAGGTWATPVKVGLGPDSVHVYVGVDGSGNVTAAWSTGNGGPMNPSVTSIATWPATSATPTVQILDTSLLPTPEPVYINDLAVDSAGQAVLAGLAGDFDMVLGYRASPTGAWAYNQKMGVSGSLALQDPHVAINDTGNAVVSYHTTATIWASRRNAFADWGSVETVAAAGNAESRSVAIDAAGNTYVAFAVGTGPSDVSAGAAFRPVGGDWSLQYPLSPQGSTFVAREVTVAINKTGAAFLTWSQTGPAPADSSINGRPGSNGVWGAIERVSEMGPDFPATVVGGDGTVLTVWEHNPGADPLTGFARMRSPAGVWGDLRPLSAPYTGFAAPNAATDGRGHFAVVTAPQLGTAKQVMLSTFDSVAPAVSPISVSGSALAGAATGLSVTATDEWSAIPTVTWAFGDGGAGAGTAVSHAYASAGSYTATVTVVDAAGNAATRQLVLTISAAQSTLTTARFAAKWKQSRVKGTLIVNGSAPRAGTYDIDVSKGTSRKIHASFTLPAGPFSRTLKLPAKLAPGSYHVALLPSFPATQVKPAAQDARLAAPPEGVVDLVALSGRFNGPATRTLRNINTVWATFRFVAVPKGNLKVTWYLKSKGKGKRQRLGSATKSPGVKVASFIQLGGRRGKVTAVISRKGVVIAQGSVKVV